MNEFLENPIVRHWIFILSITIFSVAIWPLTLWVRRWWLSPFYNARVLERELVKRLRIDHKQHQNVRQLLGTKDPILVSQYLVDPKIASTRNNPSEKQPTAS